MFDGYDPSCLKFDQYPNPGLTDPMAANSLNFTKAALLAIPSAPNGTRRTYRDYRDRL